MQLVMTCPTGTARGLQPASSDSELCHVECLPVIARCSLWYHVSTLQLTMQNGASPSSFIHPIPFWTLSSGTTPTAKHSWHIGTHSQRISRTPSVVCSVRWSTSLRVASIGCIGGSARAVAHRGNPVVTLMKRPHLMLTQSTRPQQVPRHRGASCLLKVRKRHQSTTVTLATWQHDVGSSETSTASDSNLNASRWRIASG